METSFWEDVSSLFIISVKTGYYKIETIFKPKTSEWQDTHTTHTEGDNDNQLIVHISPHGMCYDAKNKNKVTMEDWNLGKKL